MHDEHQDQSDVALAAEGDLDAFERIVQRWQHRLINLAWRFCRDRATAEDMAQEVFLKVFRSLGTFRRESAFSSWITAVALNTYRSRIRREGLPLGSVDLSRMACPGMDISSVIEQSRRDEGVRATVLTLPERYRQAILMYYFEEKDVAETSKILGVSEGTLKARLHRARDLLKRRCLGLGLWSKT